MIASELIQSQVPVLRLSDTIKTALNYFEEYKLLQIPVIGPKGYMGLLEEEIALSNTENKELNDLQNVLLKHKIQEEEHLYSALTYFLKSNLCILPVIDVNQKYLGCITATDLFKKTCEWLSVDNLGGLLHLEIEQQNYSLVQIAQIVESSDAKIISCVCIPKKNEPSVLEVIIKINREELSSIIQTFERYEYKIIATFHKNIHQKGLDDRFDSFIRYLNI
jgi:acetoin utilization protein AcuB|tara:strand:+ start:2969 stop:3631 length:663 start_codon:yes stop_codon:yes gene_type:complete